jgi:hypothetical protein
VDALEVVPPFLGGEQHLIIIKSSVIIIKVVPPFLGGEQHRGLAQRGNPPCELLARPLPLLLAGGAAARRAAAARHDRHGGSGRRPGLS